MCVEWFIHSEGRGHGKQERGRQGQGRDIVVPQRNEPLLHRVATKILQRYRGRAADAGYKIL